MRMCVRAHIRVGKGDRRAKLCISSEPLANRANVFRCFEQGSTKQTENMNVSTVLSKLSSDICRFQQTSQTSLDVNELVFFSIRLQRYNHLVPNYGIMQTTSGKVAQKVLHELHREEDSFLLSPSMYDTQKPLCHVPVRRLFHLATCALWHLYGLQIAESCCISKW